VKVPSLIVLRIILVSATCPILFLMTQEKAQALMSESSKAAVPELPIIQQGDQLLIEARVLHQKLQSSQQFSDWVKARIGYFEFVEGEDYFISLRNRSDGKKGKQRVDYLLTIDTAKELAMLERNDIGRSIRRYFIQKEKEARAVTLFRPSQQQFIGLERRRFNNRVMLPYRDVLVRCGYKVSNNGGRAARYWMHFIKEGTRLWVTEDFATHLYHSRQVYVNRQVMKASQPVLPFGWGDNSKLQGGMA
jgi:phage anti-repressor protein